MFQQITRLDQRTRQRIADVAATAREFGEQGIVAWAQRAVADAQALGRLRDRDIAALERLEDTFDHDFYRKQSTGVAQFNFSDEYNPVYA